MLWSADTFDWRPKAPPPPPTDDAAEAIAREIVGAMAAGFTRTEPVSSLEFAARKDRVYVCSQDGYLYCANRGGQLRWHFPSALGDSTQGVHPCVSSEEPSGQSILVGYQSGAVKLLTADGQQEWCSSLRDMPEEVEWSSDGRVVAVRGRDQRLYLLSREGRILAERKLRKAHGTCAFVGQTLLVADDKLHAVSVDLDEALQAASSGVRVSRVPQKIPAWMYPESDETICGMVALAPEVPALVVAHRKERLSASEDARERAMLQEGRPFAFYHVVRQLDTRGGVQWETVFPSDVTCIGVADDARSVLVALWGTGLAYDHAEVRFLNSRGKPYATQETESNIVRAAYVARRQIFESVSFNGHLYRFGLDGRVLERIPPHEEHSIAFEGALSDGRLVRVIATDKKTYDILHDGQVSGSLATTAQINDVVRLPGADSLVLRIGTNKLRCVDLRGNVAWEWTSKGRMTTIAGATAAGLVLAEHGDEVAALDTSGAPVWTMKMPANADHSLTVLNEIGGEGDVLLGSGDRYDYKLTRADRAGKPVWEFGVQDFRHAEASRDGKWVFVFCSRRVLALDGA